MCRVVTSFDRPEARVMGAVPAKARKPVGGGEARRVITDLGKEATSKDGPNAGCGAKQLGVVVALEGLRKGTLELGDRGLHGVDDTNQAEDSQGQGVFDLGWLAQRWCP
jgi:hypothetical protein